jgi:hypothetical protein
MDEANEVLEQLEELIGLEAAMKVFDFFQGENIYFPKRVALEVLYNEIYQELKQGASYRDMCAKYGYTDSHIRQIERRCIEKERRMRRANQASQDTWRPKARRENAARKPAPKKQKVFYLGELFDE